MRVAIISLSEEGLKLSKKLKSILDEDSTIIKTDLFYKNVKKNFNIGFSEYDEIIAIMATGIVIRSINNLIVSKTTDPGVINIDEKGEFVVSLLSGHIGGANNFTRKISNYLGAKEVITTSTDLNNKIAIDYLSNLFYLKISNSKKILDFNKAILKDKKIKLLFNKKTNLTYLIDFINSKNIKEYEISYDENVLENEVKCMVDKSTLSLFERELVLGIGCKKGKSCNDILIGVKKALNDLNLPITRINTISTGEMKINEKGIIDLSNHLKLPLKFVDLEELKLFKSKDLSTSEFVKSKFGIEGVSEQSAMIVAGFDSKLIYKKTAFNGVTIAFSISK